MRPITVLDQQTIDKIAAGEVVERPASVVKELVEHSIDAGAASITVEIDKGGKSLIRITDNGSGLEASQVPTAFLSHATSKIEKAEDIENIASLGFRGEALSSIAAVSRVEVITKTPSALCGVRYCIEGGTGGEIEEIGAPDGTTFIVRDLFYNTPARKKFLKSDASEGMEVGSLMEQLSLSHPEIAFKYMQNGQVKLFTSGSGRLKDVIYYVYGKEIAKMLLEVSGENEFMKVSGFIGKPELSRGNRSFENTYVNGRYIRSTILTKAVEEGFKGFLMQHRFPFALLSIDMKGGEVDVNVHPRKMEVRFSRGQEVYETITELVHCALTGRELIPKVQPGRETKQAAPARENWDKGQIPEPFENKMPLLAAQASLESCRKADPDEGGQTKALAVHFEEEELPPVSLTPSEESMFSGTLRENQADETQYYPGKNESEMETAFVSGVESTETAILSSENNESTDKSEVKPEPSEESGSVTEGQMELFEDRFLAPESRCRHRLIGQVFDTYWLVEFDDRFLIIDQHAAHEKIYYEQFVTQLGSKEPSSQQLYPPVMTSLTLEEEAFYLQEAQLFEKAGFEVEHYGGREYCIRAVPQNLYGFKEEELFHEILDAAGGGKGKKPVTWFAHQLASMACKAAVKGNHVMSFEEADAMIDKLLTLDEPFHCPHGRPTIIEMTRADMDKKFHRIM